MYLYCNNLGFFFYLRLFRIEYDNAGYTANKVAREWAGAVMEKAYSSIGAEAVMQKAPKRMRKDSAIEIFSR